MNARTASQGTPRIWMTLPELRCLRGLYIIFSNTGDIEAFIFVKKSKRQSQISSARVCRKHQAGQAEKERFLKWEQSNGRIHTRMLECAGMRRAPEVMMWTSGSGSSLAMPEELRYRSSENLKDVIRLSSIWERERETLFVGGGTKLVASSFIGSAG